MGKSANALYMSTSQRAAEAAKKARKKQRQSVFLAIAAGTVLYWSSVWGHEFYAYHNAHWVASYPVSLVAIPILGLAALAAGLGFLAYAEDDESIWVAALRLLAQACREAVGYFYQLRSD